MGGRGANFRINHGANGLGPRTSIADMEKRRDQLGSRMDQLVRTTDDNGLMTAAARREYYNVKSQRDDVVRALGDAYRQRAANRKPDQNQQHTFVNSYGEATRRNITSPSYDRDQKRKQKQVLRNMGY